MIGSLRNWLKRRFYRFLASVLESDAGHDLLIRALEGRYRANRPAAPPALASAPPYPGLADPVSSRISGRRRQPVFITGRFRSGSTLLWQVFRGLKEFTAYYEPFNERRWFRRDLRGDRIDPTHLGVDDYWREYDGMQDLESLYREQWSKRRFFMDSQDWDQAMLDFLTVLIERAPARPVLQFNRVDFRLAWLRHNFPDATILHLYRHPRDQWLSSLGRHTDFPVDGTLSDFAAADGFYLLRWARDLQHTFPFLPVAGSDHPYRLFYLLWRLSFAFGIESADISVSFEHLVGDPREQLDRVFTAIGAAGIDLDLAAEPIRQPSIGRWKSYADESWYRAHEAWCEAILALSSAARKPNRSPR